MSLINSSDEEFLNFFKNYMGSDIKYRTEPPDSVQKPPFKILDILKCVVSLDFNRAFYPISVHEPLTYTQRGAEREKDYFLLNLASESTNIINRLAYVGAFIVSTASWTAPRRCCKPLVPILGETLEYVDFENKYLFISEQVSINPPLTAFHSQCEKWEMSHMLDLNPVFLFNKIKMVNNRGIIIKFYDGNTFTSPMPTFYIKNLTAPFQLIDFVDTVTIKHGQSSSKAVINFLGSKEYSLDDCIEGALYDENDKIQGYLKGSYLTKITYVNSKTNEERIVWKKAEERIFPDFFGFRESTLRLNDSNYHTECPTDSRKRPDARAIEFGDYIKADEQKKLMEDKQRAEGKKQAQENLAYEPRWFKIIPGEKNKKEYAYNRQYWNAKLTNDFSSSPDIFNC